MTCRTNTLDDLRRKVADALGAMDHLPERIDPPLTMLVAGSPYVEGGDAYGTFNIRFTAVVVVGRSENAEATAALDAQVTWAIVQLDNAGIALERVDQPSMLQHGGGNFLSTTIDVLIAGVRIDDGRG